MPRASRRARQRFGRKPKTRNWPWLEPPRRGPRPIDNGNTRSVDLHHHAAIKICHKKPRLNRGGGHKQSSKNRPPNGQRGLNARVARCGACGEYDDGSRRGGENGKGWLRAAIGKNWLSSIQLRDL